MKTIKYKKLWPGGNTTALVTDRLTRDVYADVANKIIAADPSIEQVGFMEEPEGGNAMVRLQMMGGEFCGNATRSAAFLWSQDHPTALVQIEASGTPEVLQVKINRQNADLELPGDFFITLRQVEEGSMVDLSGIRHLIIFGNQKDFNTEALINKYSENFAAIGIIYVQVEGKKITSKPFIWVRETNTLIPETGCASGSIAASIAVHQKEEGNSFSVLQPSMESYTVDLELDGEKISKITLKGPVKIIGEGTIDADLA